MYITDIQQKGYANSISFGSRSGTRTRVSTVRGWRANRYTNRPVGYKGEAYHHLLFPFCSAKLGIISELAKFLNEFFQNFCH